MVAFTLLFIGGVLMFIAVSGKGPDLFSIVVYGKQRVPPNTSPAPEPPIHTEPPVAPPIPDR